MTNKKIVTIRNNKYDIVAVLGIDFDNGLISVANNGEFSVTIKSVDKSDANV